MLFMFLKDGEFNLLHHNKIIPSIIHWQCFKFIKLNLNDFYFIVISPVLISNDNSMDIIPAF